ncbi:MAG TPA: chalcone isomerase family protein [Polyangia bacterium]|jgi:tetratricopeptide (TPR) repeat protein
MRTLTASLVLVACIASAWTVRADDEKRTAAKRFYDSGMLLYDRGEFLDAAKEFERSYGEAPLPAMLYNIAQAYDKGGDRARAVENYRKYVKAAPDAKDNAVAASRADVLEREWKELQAARQASAQPARKLAPPLPFVEPITKYTYQTWITVDGKPYTLLGAGARKVAWFKVYAMGLYVEDGPARAKFPELAAKAGGSDHDSLVRGDLANQWLVLGDFGKVALLHFVRNVSGKETRDAYREALGDDASQSAPDTLRRASEEFLALFDDIKDGENLTIRTLPDGQIIVEARGKRRMGPKNQRLSHDLWAIWMGEKPISSDLKRKLVDRIDTLGR